MKLDIVSLDGKKSGSLELSDAVFAVPTNEHLLWEVVRAQLAARRRGTSKVKGRSEVKATRKKTYRQKGTGGARHGNETAPIFVGGGQVFGPHPRDYSQNLPKEVRKAALRVAVSLRAREGNLLIVKDLGLPAIKTKDAAAKLSKLGAENSLLVEQRDNEALRKSVRNLQRVKSLAPEGLNVYDVLNHARLVMTPETAKAIETRLG